MKQRVFLAAAAATLSIASLPAFAGNQFAVALGGYDTVAYHAGTPTPGDARLNHFWKGATWYFSTEAYRDTFASDPERFAPAYDGY